MRIGIHIKILFPKNMLTILLQVAFVLTALYLFYYAFAGLASGQIFVVGKKEMISFQGDTLIFGFITVSTFALFVLQMGLYRSFPKHKQFMNKVFAIVIPLWLILYFIGKLLVL